MLTNKAGMLDGLQAKVADVIADEMRAQEQCD